MRILVCPLDWGLGHATRCIPLVRALIASGHHVRIGAAGGGLHLLRDEFPSLEVFEFPGYRVRYSRSPAWFLPVLLAQMPKVLLGMFAESRRLRRCLAEHPCDAVISDGRYGVRSESVPTIFITHQVFIRVPGRFPGSGLLEALVLALNLRLLKRFTRVWVPDVPGPGSLSGDLSHKPCGLANLEFIGPLSRFPAPGEADSAPSVRVDVLAVVSGPEPQRGLFETALRRELGCLQGTRVLVRGLPDGGSGAVAILAPGSIRPDALTEFPHLSGRDLARLFAGAGLIVARSGYTTVMELAALGCRAVILVPTPGQSEQEYLADHLEGTGAAKRMDQDTLDLSRASSEVSRMEGFARWRSGPRGTTGERELSLADFLSGHPVLGTASLGKPSLDVHKPRQQ